MLIAKYGDYCLLHKKSDCIYEIWDDGLSCKITANNDEEAIGKFAHWGKVIKDFIEKAV